MKPMYPGVAFSPSTQLSAEINEIDTVIPVDNIDAFPAAPNLATIGTDGEGETVLYAAKTSTALSGCTRGYQGRAQQWSKGETVARTFTQADHQALIENAQELDARGQQLAQEVEAQNQEVDAKLQLLQSQSIHPAVHTKTGTVHNLEVENITGGGALKFTATGDYKDGDSWTINGAPVTVTYANGDPLLPTAVLAGDVVVGVLEGSVLRLLMDKPTPQPNMLINGDFTDPINQRAKTAYTELGYTVDDWCMGLGGVLSEVAIVQGGLRINSLQTLANGNAAITQFNPPIRAGASYCLTVDIGEIAGLVYPDVYNVRNGAYLQGGWVQRGINVWRIQIPDDWAPDDAVRWSVVSPISESNKSDVTVARIKLEPGDRFTGWDYKSFEERLAECQVHQFNPLYRATVGQGYIFQGIASPDGRLLYGIMPTPVTMRAKPSISANLAKFELWGEGTTSIKIKHVSTFNKMDHGVIVRAETEGPVLKPGGTYIMYTMAATDPGIILLDANIY